MEKTLQVLNRMEAAGVVGRYAIGGAIAATFYVQEQVQLVKDRNEIAGLLEQRQARRRRLAKLSFEEKIEIVERLRDLRLNRGFMRTKETREQTDASVKPEDMSHP